MKPVITTYCQINNDKAMLNGQTIYSNPGEQDFLKFLYRTMELNYPKFFKMDDLCRLGFLGVEAIIANRPDFSRKSDDAVAMVFQNEMSSLDSDLNHQDQLNKGIPSPATFVYTLPNIVIGEISIRRQWFGESAFFVGKSGNYEVLTDYVKSLILTRKAEMVLSGRIDSFQGKHHLNLVTVELDEAGDEFNARRMNELFSDADCTWKT